MKHLQTHTEKNTAGFTLVEVLVTIVIAALFIAAISQVHITQTKLGSSMVAYNNADLLAYNNLRTYAYGKSPSWFECNYSGGNPLPVTLLDISTPVAGIDAPVSQTVIATAPYGCGGSSTSIGYPIKVVSTVTYGSDARKVVHATYATY